MTDQPCHCHNCRDAFHLNIELLAPPLPTPSSPAIALLSNVTGNRNSLITCQTQKISCEALASQCCSHRQPATRVASSLEFPCHNSRYCLFEPVSEHFLIPCLVQILRAMSPVALIYLAVNV